MSGAERKGLESLETMPVAVEAPLFPSGVEAGSRGSGAFKKKGPTLTDRVTRHPQTRSQAALAWMPALLPPVALSCSALRSRCLGTKSCSGTSLGPTDAGVPSRGHRVEGGATDGSVSTLPRLSVRDTRGSRIGRC